MHSMYQELGDLNRKLEDTVFEQGRVMYVCLKLPGVTHLK